jgi:capsule polysaccharide export protein KpsE/RkpR
MRTSNRELKPEMTARAEPAGGLALVRLRWRFVSLFGAGGLALALAYLLFAPKWYEAEIMIVPPPSQTDMLAAGSVLGSLPLAMDGLSSLASSDSDRIAAVLASRSVSDAIIQQFHLMDRYDVDKIEKARRKLWKVCATTVEKKGNLVRLACQDKVPEVARDMAAAFGRIADAGFRRISIASARERRAFLEIQVSQARRELEEASQAVRKFQEANAVIDLPEQGKAVVSGLATLEADLIGKRIQLAYSRGFASDEEASVAQLRRQIGVIKAELSSLESGPAARSGERAGAVQPPAQTSIFPPALQLPRLRAELQGLMRVEKVRETVFLMLTERFEALKVDEARNLSTFVVFDEAVLPTHRVRPTPVALVVGLMAGLVLGALFLVIPAWWSDLRRRAVLERSAARPA